MTNKELKKLLIDIAFNFKKYISLSITAIITIVLIFVLLASTRFVYSSYVKAKETEEKITEMHNFLDDWQLKVDKLNSAEYRPVRVKDLDDIQATILFNLQPNNLKLNSFKSLNPINVSAVQETEQPDTNEQKDINEQKQKYFQNSKHDFEIEFEGEYANVMQYINHFRAKNALINIQSVELKSKKGLIIANVKYRAYTI